ncbi:transcriptional regulator, AraC family [Chitinophaga sp. YR627]|uniref:AraC family transcriptional regulator n=1 Tax=Chitinophaga sp. YR627 TaxID=1881041 RepID=UPI0008E9A6E5|nr:AraC family transcriptional regulator [Chitinophaga sp. YR627]SFO77405.1 transcriptional regulator, AraC family [Chitinophaga sp. YR627]
MKEKTLKKREGFEGQQLIVVPRKISADFLTQDPITRQLYITDIGYYPKARYHYIKRPAGISQHIIIYCIEGKGWIEIDKKRVDILPSQFVIIPANTPHKYMSEEEEPWTIYWIHFKGEISAYIVGLILQRAKNFRLHLTYNENRIRLFEDICINLQKGYGDDNLRYVNMIFNHFLSSLLYEEKFNHSDQEERQDIIGQTITMMQEKLDKLITLQEFSQYAGLSVSHFSAVFREKTGYSPIEYFNHLKIQKACQYLLFSAATVKEIAARLGVEDQYYFSRMFSKLMGMSPSEYRNRNKTAEH